MFRYGRLQHNGWTTEDVVDAEHDGRIDDDGRGLARARLFDSEPRRTLRLRRPQQHHFITSHRRTPYRHALEAAEDTSLLASWCCEGAVAACAIVVLAMCDRLKARDRCRDHLHRPGDAIIRPPKGVASRWAMSGKRGDGDRDHIGTALTRASLGRRQIFSSVRGLPADRLRAVACRSTDSDSSREPRIGKTLERQAWCALDSLHASHNVLS